MWSYNFFRPVYTVLRYILDDGKDRAGNPTEKQLSISADSNFCISC